METREFYSSKTRGPILLGGIQTQRRFISYFFWIENIWTANICWIIQKRTQNILDKCKFQVMSGVTANDWLEDNKINRGNISWLRTILSQLHQQVQRLSKSHLRSARTGQPITRCHHRGGRGGRHQGSDQWQQTLAKMVNIMDHPRYDQISSTALTTATSQCLIIQEMLSWALEMIILVAGVPLGS